MYDAWNRLAAVYEDSDDDQAAPTDDDDGGDTLIAEYQYDGRHRRIVKLLPNGENWKRTDYYYNTSWQVIEERYNGSVGDKTTAATQEKAQYVWDTRYIDAPVVRWYDLNDDDDYGDDNEVLYYTNDANMNVTALVNTSGTVVERYQYDAYGKVTFLDGSWNLQENGDVDGIASNYGNAILFCGYRYDPETGLDCVRHRFYHPTLGRMSQRDKEGYLQGMSLYEHVLSNPIGWVDPAGLKSKCLTEWQMQQALKKAKEWQDKKVKEWVERLSRQGDLTEEGDDETQSLNKEWVKANKNYHWWRKRMRERCDRRNEGSISYNAYTVVLSLSKYDPNKDKEMSDRAREGWRAMKKLNEGLEKIGADAAVLPYVWDGTEAGINQIEALKQAMGVGDAGTTAALWHIWFKVKCWVCRCSKRKDPYGQAQWTREWELYYHNPDEWHDVQQVDNTQYMKAAQSQFMTSAVIAAVKKAAMVICKAKLSKRIAGVD